MDRDRLETAADKMVAFAGMPDTFGDNAELWRRTLGYADFLAGDDAELREYLKVTLADMAPAFFDDVQAWENAEAAGAILYAPK